MIFGTNTFIHLTSIQLGGKVKRNFQFHPDLILSAPQRDRGCSPRRRGALHQRPAHRSGPSQSFQVGLLLLGGGGSSSSRLFALSLRSLGSMDGLCCDEIVGYCNTTRLRHRAHIYIPAVLCFAAFWTSSDERPRSWRGFITSALKGSSRASCCAYL